MAPTIPPETKAKLVSQMHMDPNLSPDNPAIPSWQELPHSLAEVQPENLPPVTDFAIIASGITGCSVAKHHRFIVIVANILSNGAALVKGRNNSLRSSILTISGGSDYPPPSASGWSAV